LKIVLRRNTSEGYWEASVDGRDFFLTSSMADVPADIVIARVRNAYLGATVELVEQPEGKHR